VRVTVHGMHNSQSLTPRETSPCNELKIETSQQQKMSVNVTRSAATRVVHNAAMPGQLHGYRK
jgi:hypothetical protein